MFSIERHRKISTLLAKAGKVYVSELAELFGVTQETIRRDLTKMENQKLLKKIHGGAVNTQSKFEQKYSERIDVCKDEKTLIARETLKYIKPGDTFFINFGTTTLEFARHAKYFDNLTVITNSSKVAGVFQENDSSEVILIGGQFLRNKFECLGPIALQNMQSLYADYAIISVGAVNIEKGLMNQSLEEAAMARKMSEHSTKTIVLADSSKWYKQGITSVVDWDAVDLFVTDYNKEKDINRISDLGVNIVVARDD